MDLFRLEIIIGVFFFLILISIQYTLNKMLMLLKEIKYILQHKD